MLNTQSLINHFPSLLHAEDLKQICQPIAALGLNYFSHVRVDNQKQFSAIGMKPEFAELYLRKSYYNYDIHMAAQNNNEAYIIWDFLELDNQSQELRHDLHSFDINHSFTITQHGTHGHEYFHFGAPASNRNANHNYLRNLASFKKFIQYFKDKIHDHKELSKSYDVKFSIADTNAEFSTTTPLFVINQNQLHEQLTLSRIYVPNSDVYLTTREFECLYWMSLAKTIDEAAMILGITPRTVKAHISNIKNKTGCYTQFQLGALFQRLI